VLHTTAYWLMLTERDAIPKALQLATAEFATLRLRLLKIAVRVVETASRIRLAFAAACPKPTSSAACLALCSRSVRNRPGLRPITNPIPPARPKQIWSKTR
jgi:hypothetical protein